MAHMLHLSPWSRLPLNVCWFVEKYKRPLLPVPPSHVRVHSDFIHCSKDQEDAQEDDYFKENGRDSFSSQENDENEETERKEDESSISEEEAGSDESFMALVNIYRKRAPSPKKTQSPVRTQIATHNSLICVLCKKAIDKKSSLSCTDINCQSHYHSLCISDRCLSDENGASTIEQLIPVKFSCPTCGMSSPWGEYIRSVRGFNTAVVDNPEESPFLGQNCVRRIVQSSQSQKK